MSDCCTPLGYRRIFSEKNAARQAALYRSRGMDGVSRRLVQEVLERGVRGATVLEVGGGIGAVQIELLRAGAARVISVEMTPTYEAVAAGLLREAGLEGKVERRILDFAAAASEIPSADVVIMNRVVCCYPNMTMLVRAAADHTRGLLVMSFPRRRWWTRALLTAGNLGFRLTRREFHIFLHWPTRIRATAEALGLAARRDREGWLWQISSFERRAEAGG